MKTFSAIFKRLMISRVSVNYSVLKKVLTTLFIVSATIDISCQSLARWVITPYGSSYYNNFQAVQATLGEPVIVTVTDSLSFYLTQGFQQPSPSEVLYQDISPTIRIAPNPVITMASVTFFVKDIDDFTIDIVDLLGNMILRKKVYDVYSGQAEFFDFSGLSQGIYFVHVYSANDEMENIEKIVKL